MFDDALNSTQVEAESKEETVYPIRNGTYLKFRETCHSHSVMIEFIMGKGWVLGYSVPVSQGERRNPPTSYFCGSVL